MMSSSIQLVLINAVEIAGTISLYLFGGLFLATLVLAILYFLALLTDFAFSITDRENGFRFYFAKDRDHLGPFVNK